MTDVERFCAAHHDGVFRYLRRVVGAAESARDLTQEVFLRVSRAGVPEANDIGQRAWLFRIARNLALNHLRDGRRRPPTVTFGSAAVPATQELAVALSHAIDALPDLDRDVFLLRETAGLSYEEIAAASELPLESVTFAAAPGETGVARHARTFAGAQGTTWSPVSASRHARRRRLRPVKAG